MQTSKICPCGSKAVRLFNNVWSCQRCIDLDAIVEEMHRKYATYRVKADTVSFEDRLERERAAARQRYYDRKARKQQHEQSNNTVTGEDAAGGLDGCGSGEVQLVHEAA